MLPDGVAAHIDLARGRRPPVFGWLQQAGSLDDAEMLRTFNCGIGMIVVVAKRQRQMLSRTLVAAGEAPVLIGEIEPGRGVKSQAKGKGEAEAVRYSGRLGHQLRTSASSDAGRYTYLFPHDILGA